VTYDLYLDISKNSVPFKPNPVIYGRIGDAGLQSVTVHVFDKGEVLNLNGLTISFNGMTPNGALFTDSVGVTNINTTAGSFLYTFPKHVFESVGAFRLAHFTLTNVIGQATTQDFSLHVLDTVDMTAKEAEVILVGYNQLVTQLQDIANQFKEDLKDQAHEELRTLHALIHEFIQDPAWDRMEELAQAFESLKTEIESVTAQLANEIRQDYEERLKVIHQTISETQLQVDLLKAQIEMNDIVTQDEFNQLPVRRRIQVTDWDALDNTVLGLRHGESVMVYADTGSLNSPWGGINSMAGIAYLTSNNGDHIAIEVYRSSNTVTRDRKAMRFRGFNGWGEWKYGADTATRLQTPRTINGVAFDGSTNITVTADPTTTRIAANADLNSILTPGNYNNPLIAEATTIANTPLNEAFSLQVIRHGANDSSAGTQIFTNFQNQNSNFRRFIRNRNGAVWGPWFELPMTMGTARTYDMSVTRADQLAVPRNIVLNGDMSGNAWFDGSGDVNIRTTLDRQGWFNLTPINGTSSHSTGATPQYCKIGSVVYLRGAFTNIRNEYTVCAILPAEFRPVGQNHSFVQNTSRANGITYFVRWTIKTNGEIELERVNRTDGYDAGNWFPVHTSFVAG